MKSRNDELFSRIEEYAARHSGPNPESYLYWLQDGDHGEVFCNKCVFAMPALPGLVVCSLLMICGHKFGARSHICKDENHRCNNCDDWVDKRSNECFSIPEQITYEANEQRDGGWRDEEDSLRTCDNEYCCVRLDVCLTGYGAFEELRHWEDYGPPEEADDWQAFSEMLNSIENKHLPRLEIMWNKWKLICCD